MKYKKYTEKIIRIDTYPKIQWAAVKICLSEIIVPPQNGKDLLAVPILIDTTHGYSFGSVGFPFTTLLNLPLVILP